MKYNNSATPTFFFYDLETSGLSPRDDRIMQFAGQRTDLDLHEIGEPVNLLVKLSEDTLPSPQAIAVTGITPQATQRDGLSEAELCDYLLENIFTPGTVAVGYNSTRFDDEFIRHLFWRNFRDPYEWQWSDGRSKWDLLDVVRMTRALRPEGIEWPVTAEGRATNRLELLTKLNGITHQHAHDALSDVEALISVTRLVRTKQPQLYEYLFQHRTKRAVAKLADLDHPRPLVYSSGRYGGDFQHTTVVYPLAPGRNGNILVFDLRYDLEELLKNGQTLKSQENFQSGANLNSDGDFKSNGNFNSGANLNLNQNSNSRKNSNLPSRPEFFPIVKELCLNKCPALAPLGVLASQNGWSKISLTEQTVQTHLKHLLRHPEFATKMATAYADRPEWPPAVDPESALYDGFLPEPDRVRCAAVRNADAKKLADFHPVFVDERLSDLLLHYKARNFPSALSADEVAAWDHYRAARLNRQSQKFLEGLAALQKSTENETNVDPFILEELQLWYQALL